MPRLVTNELQRAVWRWDQQEPFGVNVPDENPSSLGAFEFPPGVTRRNCRDFVDDCLRRCDIASSRIRPGPRPYFDDLSRRCKESVECRP